MHNERTYTGLVVPITTGLLPDRKEPVYTYSLYRACLTRFSYLTTPLVSYRKTM